MTIIHHNRSIHSRSTFAPISAIMWSFVLFFTDISTTIKLNFFPGAILLWVRCCCCFYLFLCSFYLENSHPTRSFSVFRFFIAAAHSIGNKRKVVFLIGYDWILSILFCVWYGFVFSICCFCICCCFSLPHDTFRWYAC